MPLFVAPRGAAQAPYVQPTKFQRGDYLGLSQTRDAIAVRATNLQRRNSMQKKVMAVAVAGALGALVAPAAVAQTSTVQIGGSIHLIYVQSRAKNSLPLNASG